MGKLNSTVPGLPYPSGRDNFLSTSYGFLEGRRNDDGAESLWRINDSLYDLTEFSRKHPGGSEWITLTKGTDITELFEVFFWLSKLHFQNSLLHWESRLFENFSLITYPTKQKSCFQSYSFAMCPLHERFHSHSSPTDFTKCLNCAWEKPWKM